MVTTDPIADLLTRMRNALIARHDTVIVPLSKMKKAIADILLEEGYVSAVEVVPVKDKNSDKQHDVIRITLKYGPPSRRSSPISRGSPSPVCAFTQASRICPRCSTVWGSPSSRPPKAS